MLGNLEIDINGNALIKWVDKHCIIFTKMDATGNENIVLDGISKGVYIVSITSGEHVHHYRMVKAN